jgi:hypothetical protein
MLTSTSLGHASRLSMRVSLLLACCPASARPDRLTVPNKLLRPTRILRKQAAPPDPARRDDAGGGIAGTHPWLSEGPAAGRSTGHPSHLQADREAHRGSHATRRRSPRPAGGREPWHSHGLQPGPPAPVFLIASDQIADVAWPLRIEPASRPVSQTKARSDPLQMAPGLPHVAPDVIRPGDMR